MARHEFSHRSLHGAPRGRRRLFFATLLILVVFALDLLLGGALRSIVRTGASSIWSAASDMRTAADGSGFFSRNSTLAQENVELRADLDRVRERAAAYQSLKEESDLLRGMLNLAQTSPGIAAPIVSSYHASPYGTFMVGAGSGSVAVGDLAVSETGFVIGRVADVQATRSLVKTIFLSGSSIDVVLGNAAVTAIGQGGGNARVSIPRGIMVSSGDTVTAPEFGGRPVGVVGKVEEVTTTAEQIIYISLPVNVTLMRFVYVVPAP